MRPLRVGKGLMQPGKIRLPKIVCFSGVFARVVCRRIPLPRLIALEFPSLGHRRSIIPSSTRRQGRMRNLADGVWSRRSSLIR